MIGIDIKATSSFRGHGCARTSGKAKSALISSSKKTTGVKREEAFMGIVAARFSPGPG